MIGTGYGGFSEVYDRLMADYDYSAILRKIEETVAPNGKRGLDLCCGTGTVAVALSRAGAEMCAMDLEPAMLNLARDKARGEGFGIRFFAGDVNDLPEMRPFDFIVSTCDGLNYVKNPERFARALWRTLVPGGKTVLEFSSLYKAQTVLSKGLFYEDGEEITWFFQNEFKEKSNRVNESLTIFKRLPDGRYERSDDESTQYFYENERLIAAFRDARFKNVALCATRGFAAETEGAERLTLTGEKKIDG